MSHAKASRGPRANLGPAESQHILHQLRESIAQDVAGLSVYLYVLQGEVESAALASRIAKLQQVAAAALHDIIALANAIEEATASRVEVVWDKRTGAKRMSKRGYSTRMPSGRR